MNALIKPYVEAVDRRAYAEFLLRQAISDALKALGEETTKKVIQEEIS